jgi:hypothetical protein
MERAGPRSGSTSCRRTRSLKREPPALSRPLSYNNWHRKVRIGDSRSVMIVPTATVLLRDACKVAFSVNCPLHPVQRVEFTENPVSRELRPGVDDAKGVLSGPIRRTNGAVPAQFRFGFCVIGCYVRTGHLSRCTLRMCS